jgi:hypothetical protein
MGDRGQGLRGWDRVVDFEAVEGGLGGGRAAGRVWGGGSADRVVDFETDAEAHAVLELLGGGGGDVAAVVVLLDGVRAGVAAVVVLLGGGRAEVAGGAVRRGLACLRAVLVDELLHVVLPPRASAVCGETAPGGAAGGAPRCFRRFAWAAGSSWSAAPSPAAAP